jgi:hypothetical protein
MESDEIQRVPRIHYFLNLAFLYFIITINIILTLFVFVVLHIDISPIRLAILDNFNPLVVKEIISFLFNKFIYFADYIYQAFQTG